LEPVILKKDASIEQILSYYMGKNTPERQEFIIDNLVVEKNDEELALIKEAESQQEVVA
jgi:topoisomerase-4 subunit B